MTTITDPPARQPAPPPAGRPLTGRRALVTGGTRGIGRGIVRRLIDDGARVAFTHVSDRSRSIAEEVVAEARAAGGEALAFTADSGDPAQVARVIEEISGRWGGLDIVVNNAAVSIYKPFEEFTRDDAERTYRTNVLGPLTVSQAALAVLGEGGRIINIGSTVATRVPRRESALYASSKSALIGLTKGMARDLGPRRITVNLVNPGPTATEMLHRHSPEKIEAMLSFMALDELAGPQHTAAIVAALARDDADYVTGAIIGVDGGYTI